MQNNMIEDSESKQRKACKPKLPAVEAHQCEDRPVVQEDSESKRESRPEYT